MYAKKCEADYYKVSVADDFLPAKGKHLDYQKLKIYDFIDYDRVVYLDSDFIIKDNAPNIFNLCGDNFAAVIDPGKTVGELASNLGIPRDNYFNAGFMHITKNVLNKTKEFLAEYLEKEYEYQGQGLLNKLFYDKNINIKQLDAREWNPVNKTFGLYADHYAGGRKRKWGTVIY
jgi:lipopolysaccharide biosynthesis glycosyltransferase